MNSYVSNVVLLGSSVGLGLGLIWLGYRYFYRQKKPYVAGVVSSLHLYPVKSCGGIDLNELQVEKLGVHLDRHWVIVDAKGLLVTQRKIPKMVFIQPSFDDGHHLCLDAPGMPQVKINVDITEEDEQTKAIIDVFGLTCEGYYCGDEISEWISTYLEKPGLKLYSGRNKNLKRQNLQEDPVWAGGAAKEGDEMMYQDSGPVNILSEASVKALNSHIDNPVPVKSFRPNILVKGCGPYDEDSWKIVLIGDVLMRKLGPCLRCSLTTIDPDTGTKRPSKEPLVTLKRVRYPDDKRYGTSPMFANLYVADQVGKVNIGDEVLVLK